MIFFSPFACLFTYTILLFNPSIHLSLSLSHSHSLYAILTSDRLINTPPPILSLTRCWPCLDRGRVWSSKRTIRVPRVVCSEAPPPAVKLRLLHWNSAHSSEGRREELNNLIVDYFVIIIFVLLFVYTQIYIYYIYLYIFIYIYIYIHC